MTDELKEAFEQLAIGQYDNTHGVLAEWIDVTNEVEWDTMCLMLHLVEDADIKNQLGMDPRTRKGIAKWQSLVEIAQLAPWNELFTVDPSGWVTVSMSMTVEEIAELSRFHMPYRSGICQSPTEFLEQFAGETKRPLDRTNENEGVDQLAQPINPDRSFEILRTVNRQRRSLPNTAAKRMLRSCVLMRNLDEIAPNQWIVYKGDFTIAFDPDSQRYAQVGDAGGIGEYEGLASLAARLDKEIDPANYPESNQAS